MVIGRKKRIFVGIIVPISIIPLVLFIGGLVTLKDPGKVLLISLTVLFFSTIIISIPSIIYSVTMEYLLNPKLNNNFIVVVLSTFLGTLSAYPMHKLDWYVVGAIVGFGLGSYLRYDYIKKVGH